MTDPTIGIAAVPPDAVIAKVASESQIQVVQETTASADSTSGLNTAAVPQSYREPNTPDARPQNCGRY